VWQDDRAVTGETTEQFIVPWEDATDEDGTLLPDESGESDSLRFHENAPDVVREWSGPFYITLSPTDVPPFEGPWPRWAKQT